MQLRTIKAQNVQAAMQIARDEMGDDAVILSSAIDGDTVSVTFALDRGDDPDLSETPVAPTPRAPTPYIPAERGVGMEEVLFHHGTPEVVIRALMEKISLKAGGNNPSLSFSELTQQASTLLNQCFRFKPLPLEETGFKLMMVGLPGVGKTMTVAKIAARMVVENNPIRVITTDSNRAAGTEQLQAFTRILGIDLQVASSRDELAAILADCDRNMRVIIDSAGCNPYDFQELRDLGECAGIDGIEPVLVCSAGIDAGEAQEIAGVFSFLNSDRVLISRTDCARRYGSALALAYAGDYAFSHYTSSARAMGDLQTLTATALAQLLTHYKRERIAA